jgi:hypothetical protein
MPFENTQKSREPVKSKSSNPIGIIFIILGVVSGLFIADGIISLKFIRSC